MLPGPAPLEWAVPFDLLQQTQDAKTSIYRQTLDNMNHCNNQGQIYNPSETNPEDIANRAPGRGIRSTNPANVLPITIPDITGNAMTMLSRLGS